MGSWITRRDLDGITTRMLSEGRNWTKGQVRLVSWEGRPLAVKDISRTPPVFRKLLGEWILRREQEILRDLEGFREIPHLHSRIDRWAFAREFVEGKPLRLHRPGEVPEATFRHLLEVIGRLHARGIAHGDLHHRNILLDGPERLYLIDFSNSIRRGNGWNLLNRWFFHQVCRIDRRSILKLKSRFLPEGLSRREKAILEDDPILYRMGRWFRRRRHPV